LGRVVAPVRHAGSRKHGPAGHGQWPKRLPYGSLMLATRPAEHARSEAAASRWSRFWAILGRPMGWPWADDMRPSRRTRGAAVSSQQPSTAARRGAARTAARAKSSLLSRDSQCESSVRDSLQRLGVVHALARGAVGWCPGDALPGSWDLWAKPGAAGVPLHSCARPNTRPKTGPKSNRSRSAFRQPERGLANFHSDFR
jgi:hypothetical protein